MLSTVGSSIFIELFYYLRKRTRSNWRFQISDHVMELLYLQAITWYEWPKAQYLRQRLF